ncbi:MAG: AAA family ATPase [Microthrixaceae bacterium]|nr:AAA family ATPase [Microthrixaceae bacterium]
MSGLPPVHEPSELAWDRFREHFPELDQLVGCPQEPEFHGEGDVATHTAMVLAALGDDPRFWSLDVEARSIVATAAALHDLGKPSTTRIEDGRIRQPGHARRGEILTRIALWERGVPVTVRERVANLVRFHLVPFHLVDREDRLPRLLHASVTGDGVESLLVLAAADAAGRISATRNDLLERVELARLLAEDHGVLERSWPFGSDHARVQWFRRPERDPAFVPYDDTSFEVTLLSGLPATGKDHWLQHHGRGEPAVSLDRLRNELGVDPSGPQGRVPAAARENARTHLRAHQPFIWNATNLSRRIRNGIVDLALDYGARVRIVTLEADPTSIDIRNTQRERPVPARAIARMLGAWEYPDPTEAHAIEVVDSVDDPEVHSESYRGIPASPTGSGALGAIIGSLFPR